MTEDTIMHEPNDRDNLNDLQRIQDKFHQLTPEDKVRFMIYLAFLLDSQDNLPPAFELPDQEQ